jgi:excinuclease ABC subunit C
VNIPEPIVIDPLASDLPRLLSALGRTSGIYVFASADRITHLSSSINLARRLRRLLCAPQGGPTVLASRLHGNGTAVRCWVTSSRLESLLLLYELARVHFVDDYLIRLRLRIPWFIALVDTNRFARLTVTNRLVKGAESVIGPFPSREAAQRYEEELLTSFSIRRCSEELRPAPEHPGCIYGEIKFCSRPCQSAVSENEYRREADSVRDFLLTKGRNTIKSLSSARDQAAADTDFETAAQIHKRIEKLKTAAKGRDAVITGVENFKGVAVTKGFGEGQLRLWPMLAGFWQEPILFETASICSAAPSWDSRLRDLLAPVFLHPIQEGQQEENLAVFARWYYSSWRDGDWIAWTDFDGSACRKLVRSITKLAKADVKSEPTISC